MGLKTSFFEHICCIDVISMSFFSRFSIVLIAVAIRYQLENFMIPIFKLFILSWDRRLVSVLFRGISIVLHKKLNFFTGFGTDSVVGLLRSPKQAAQTEFKKLSDITGGTFSW